MVGRPSSPDFKTNQYVSPALQGPYTYDMGMDIYGHAPNGFGRCEYLNTNNQCPPDIDTERAFLLQLDYERLVITATNWAITADEGEPQEQIVTDVIAHMYE